MRTVRNYIRDGQLAATKIGKQYRIGRAELEAFTGQPLPEPEPARHVEVSSIVAIDGVSPATADRLAVLLTSTGSPMHVQTIYDRDRCRLKVVLVGDLTGSAYTFGMIDAVVKETRT